MNALTMGEKVKTLPRYCARFARSYGHFGYETAYQDGLRAGLIVAVVATLILDAVILMLVFSGCGR